MGVTLSADPKMRALQQRATALVAGYNTDTDIAVAAMLATGNSFPSGPRAIVNAIDRPLYHRRDYAAAGATEFTFFNETEAPGVTNLPQNGAIPSQTVFALLAPAVTLIPGLLRDGTYDAAAAEALAAAATPATVAEQKRKILAMGRFELYANQKLIFECVGLDKLPSGGGLDGVAALGAAGGVTITNNGSPFAQNMRRVGIRPHLLPGGMSLKARITFPSAIAIAGASCLEVALWGTLFFK